jgi:hypothetical protein
MTGSSRTVGRGLGYVAAALVAVTMPTAVAADTPVHAVANIVNVAFVAPENFTDLGDRGYVTTDARRGVLLGDLKRHIEIRAAPRLPALSTLAVAITDIDMAGGFEGWRGPDASRVRVVRDVYPPRIKLAFRLTDESGKVIAEGERELTDPAFMTNLEYRSDLLRHEKKLLDDWLAREFPGAATRRAENQ